MNPHIDMTLKTTLRGLLGLTLALNPLVVNHAETATAKTSTDIPAKEIAKPTLTVTTVKPEEESWDININADGVISPWQEAVVAAEISGLRIVDVLADVGETVKKGQPLVKLANESIQAEIDQQLAVIAQSKSEIARAESAVAQAEAVVTQAEAGVVQAEAGVAQAMSGVEQARIGVTQAEAGVSQAQLNVIQAQVGVNQAQAGVTQTEAGLAQVNATIQQAEAGLNQAGAGVAQANAGLVQANATFQEAKTNADRARQLKSTGALPLQQVDQYLTGEKTARAGVDGQKAAINAQRSTLEAQKAAVLAQKAGLTAKKAEVESRRAEIVSAQTATKVRASEVKSQQIAVTARLQDVKSQESAVNAQRATLKMQQAAVEVQHAALKAQQSAVESQRAALQVQEAALRSHEIRMEQTTILAPDDGVISSRTAALGAVMQPGAELFRIIRDNKLEWRAEVASNDLGQISEHQPASITLATGEVVEGQVRLISPLLDAGTRRASIFVSLPAGSSARSGMFVQGTIKQGQTEAISLPQTAVILRDGHNYIFAVDDDGRVDQMEVKTGRRVKDRVEIVDKLSANLNIVATGAAFLNEGDLVRIIEGEKTP